jgi:hypothetical protein
MAAAGRRAAACGGGAAHLSALMKPVHLRMGAPVTGSTTKMQGSS